MQCRCLLTQEQIDGAIAFHGHSCPGLTIGLRASEYCLREIGRAVDEDIVVIAETDMCADDAIQYLTGCTFGKGNFIFRDTGKVAFTFIRRSDDKRVRIVLNPVFSERMQAEQEKLSPEQQEDISYKRQLRIDLLMAADLSEIFLVSTPTIETPQRARLFQSIRCDTCGEGVMASRIQEINGGRYCIDCATKLTR